MRSKRAKSEHFYFESISGGDNVNSPLVNPFLGKGHTEMCYLIDTFMDKTGIDLSYYEVIARGAFLAQDRCAFSRPREDKRRLSQEETEALEREENDKWNQPYVLYALVACCSLGASVQGFDESAINGGTVAQMALISKVLAYYLALECSASLFHISLEH